MYNIKFIILCALFLLILSASINADELQNAIKLGETTTVLKLLDKDPFLAHVKDKTGCTPILLAAYMGRNEIVSLLISLNVSIQDKDATGESPLHIAAVMNNKELAQLLLSNGANRYARDDAGLTPFDIAKEMKYVDLEQILGYKEIQVADREIIDAKRSRQPVISSRGATQPPKIKKQVSKTKTSKKIKKPKK